MKFLADDTLGALVKRLRILGFDVETLHFSRIPPKLSAEPERLFLSRSLQRVKAAKDRGFWVRPDLWVEQLQQIIEELSLPLPEESFTRCSLCNLIVEEVKDKAEIQGQVPDYIFTNHDCYYRCPGCQRIYWQGSHWEELDNFIKELKKRRKNK
jgi:hypothetical protein